MNRFDIQTLARQVVSALRSGSAAEPPLAHSGDEDTGVFFETGVVGVTVNGTEVARFASTGLTLATVLAVASGGTGLGKSPGVRLTKSGAQGSIGTGVWTTLTWNTETFDTDTLHDLVTNPSRITFTTAGVYLVSLVVAWDANQTGSRGLAIALNGARQVRAWISVFPANPDGSVELLVKAAATDYVEAQVWQNSGADRSVEASVSGEAVTAFAAQYLGPGA